MQIIFQAGAAVNNLCFWSLQAATQALIALSNLISTYSQNGDDRCDDPWFCLC